MILVNQNHNYESESREHSKERRGELTEEAGGILPEALE